MKRLFKFFAVAAIIAVGFTGCTSEEPVGPTGPDDNGTGASTKRGAETYATFKFVAEGATTKASDLGVDNTTNEGTIPFSKVRLTFFDADGFLELDTVITSFGNSATIKLTSGYKQLYVLANETSDLTTALNAVTSINNFNQTFSLDGIVNGLGDLDKIGNLYGPHILSNKTDGAGITLTGNITDTDSQDNSNPNYITVTVQRSVAKVFISHSSPSGPYVAPDTKIITLDSAAVISTSTSPDYAPSFQLWNVLAHHKPYQAGGAQIESPYYDAGAGFDWASIYARNTSPAFTSATAVATSSTPPPGGGKSYYITENTPQIPRNGSATYAAIKTTAIPTKGHYVSALSFSELNGGQFAGTKGSVDATQGVTFYVLDSLQVLTTTATGLSNGTVFAGSDAYNLARKAVYHLLNPTLPQLTTLGDYSTDQNVTAALTAAIWNKYIHVYNNGVAYYRLNIGSVVNGILKPEVKRNKFYQLNIDHYKVLGAATLAELLGDEDEEITSETYLTVKVTIDEWVPVTGGVDI